MQDWTIGLALGAIAGGGGFMVRITPTVLGEKAASGDAMEISPV